MIIETQEDLKEFVGPLNYQETKVRLRRIYAFSCAYRKAKESGATCVIDLDAIYKECAAERFSSVVFGFRVDDRFDSPSPLLVVTCNGRVAFIGMEESNNLKQMLAVDKLATKEPPF